MQENVHNEVSLIIQHTGWIRGNIQRQFLSQYSPSWGSSIMSWWEGEKVGELRLGMETELKKGRDTGWSPLRDPDLDLSLEINRENEVLRNLGKLYFGDFDFDSVEDSVLSCAFADPRMMSSIASTEDTLDRGWEAFLQYECSQGSAGSAVSTSPAFAVTW